jgi:hypothetical protein
MASVVKPRVYISYTWYTPGLKERVFDLAERLRQAGLDSRIDLYYSKSLYGLVPPDGRPGDSRDPWMVWQEDEIHEADFVLLVCTREYADRFESHPESGVWWDVHFMQEDLKSGRVDRRRFIPLGYGPYGYSAPFIPAFLKGVQYYDLTSSEGLDDLTRRIDNEFRARHPEASKPSDGPPAPFAPPSPAEERTGVFVSYSHEDKRWLDLLMKARRNREGLEQSSRIRAPRDASVPGVGVRGQP